MLVCPHCKAGLNQTRDEFGNCWICPRCGGRLATVAMLRGVVDPDHLEWIWTMGREGKGEEKRPCPKCQRLMFEVPSAPLEKAPHLDVCRYCTFIWFDPDEFEETRFLPKLDDKALGAIREMNASIAAYGVPGARKPPRKIYRNPQAEARERMAIEMIKKIKYDGQKYPDEWWKIGLAILGIPVKISDQETQKIPILTWTIALAVCIVSILSFSRAEEIFYRFGMIPSRLFRYYGFTLVSSFFLHGGWLHLLGNMYFMVTFGVNVEDHLGRRKFLLLLFLATVMGGLVHAVFQMSSSEPCIGASGGISGLIAYYMLKYPRIKLGFYFWVFLRPFWIRLSALGFFMFWVAYQVLGVWLQVKGFSNVSALAHLGGVSVGIIFFIIWGRSRKGA